MANPACSYNGRAFQIPVGSTWRYLLENGALLAPRLQLLEGGYVGGRRNPNEHRWQMRDGLFVFVDDVGRVASVFDAPQKSDDGLLRLHGRFRGGFGVLLEQIILPIGLSKAVSDLDLIADAASSGRRNLVVVRANEQSLHSTWVQDLSNQDRTWDLCVSYYGADANFDRDDIAELRVKQNRQRKYHALWSLFHEGSPLWNYDFFCFPDDDLEMKWSDLNCLFDICDYYDLSLAQPALSHDSFWNYPETLQNSEFLLRYLAMIECMMPLFSKDALKKCAPSFQLHRDGFGVDYAWSKLVGHNPCKIAIIDKVAVKHTRATGDHSANTIEGHIVSTIFGIHGHYNPKELGGIYVEAPEC